MAKRKNRPTPAAPRASTPASGPGTALAAVALGGALALACDRPSPPAPAHQTPAPAASASSAAPGPSATAAAADTLPPAPEIPVKDIDRTYVGEQRCAECHIAQHRGFTRDWHARALSPATAKYLVGDFNNAHFKGSSSEAWMTRDKAHAQMRTTGIDGALATYPVDWVIGGKRMQDTVTIFPDGRWQVLPVYFHVTGKGEWVDYTEAKQGALGPDHPFFWANFRRTANRECLDCHVTGMNVRYDRASRKWSTQMADPGVTCESCHGPGGRHAESQAPEDIIHPRKATKEVGFGVCAQCHGPRNPLFPILDASHKFVPGERYEDYFQTLGLVNGNQRSGDFFADGRPKTSSFEVQALMQSRCYQKGKATCLSCHGSPHGKHEENELLPPSPEALAATKGVKGVTRADVASCAGCHKEVFAAGAAHSHHKADKAQSCVACHMPKVVTGVLDQFADHAIDVPAPETTVKHGVPNACGTCHTKEAPGEMAKAVAAWWPSAATRTARRQRLADAFDEATREGSRPALEAVMADADEAPLLRGAAAVLFAQRFPREAAGALSPLLAAPDALTRTKAAEALGAVQARGAADALAGLRGDPSLAVREAAAISLGELNDKRAEAALRALTSAKASAGLPRPHALLGLSLSRRGALDEAITELERAVDLQPYYVDALVMLADLYAKQGHFDKTRARLEEAVTFDPQHPGARKRLATLSGGR
uniref:Tetratricopeptide protein n=1 Tax=Byssovorax cruenta TaxID=293647 RepID=A0A3S5GXX6_9BACT|nr:tetratricopeptide protein [Byssovorax cruenta]